MPRPALQAFEKEGRRGFGRERIGAFPPSSRAPRVSLAPKTSFSLPFQTPARQARDAQNTGMPISL